MTATSSKSTAKEDVPYHMQEDSDEEPVVDDDEGAKPEGNDTAKAQSLASFAKPAEGESKESFIARRRARLGKVELDPKIRSSTPFPCSEANHDGSDYADFTKNGPGLESRASLDDEGMINVWVDLKKVLPDLPTDYARPVKEYAVDPVGSKDCPPLNIVIFIVGSRGDVQPYLSLALHLIESHNHRVRIATHPDFRDFVVDCNKRLSGKKAKDGTLLKGRLEFFDVGGDPKELMAYMVKNPGLLPGWASLTNGDISSKRKMTKTMLDGFYRSTFSPDPVSQRPFAADAIISNPPAFAHVHIAEALGLPLLVSFTMPWSPTTAFKHPLVNVRKSNAESGLTNYLTYAFAEMMTWQGLGDIINVFRTDTLGLEPLTQRSGPSALDRLKIPWTYCWSDGLIDKPKDWKEHIDISGFYFLDAESEFKPDQRLLDFLYNGPPPLYIGFGSVVVEDAEAMTQTIFDAVKLAGVRALVSAGWGGLGGAKVPEEVFILKGSIPHDWLFADGRVAAVCHHGGAGTTAIGLRNGLPTIVVPFFGDQKFWGEMIHRAGAGPAPIKHTKLTPENLAEAIKFAVSEPAKSAARGMGEKIRSESGEERGVASFHNHLPLKNMRCELDPERLAMWYSPDLVLRMSGTAAGVLHDAKKLDIGKLQPLRAKEYETRARAMDPISGGTTAILHTVAMHYAGIAQIFYNPPKGILNTMTSIPQGVAGIILDVHDGFDSIPGHIGSTVRERGPVDDFESGVYEAGKGLWYGWWDGITGLITEPVEGGKKEGALGVLKGMGRSYVNVTARPAAGITGVMALPIHGAWKSLRRKMAGSPQNTLREPRTKLSQQAAKNASSEEKEKILKAFVEAVKGTGARRGKLQKQAQKYLEGDQAALEDSGPSTVLQTPGEGEAEVSADPTPTSPEESSGMRKEERKEKEAERRGYERAMEEMQIEREKDLGSKGF